MVRERDAHKDDVVQPVRPKPSEESEGGNQEEGHLEGMEEEENEEEKVAK